MRSILFCFVLVSANANAVLVDRGGGRIYDDVLGITWLQDANYAQTSGQDADGVFLWDDAVVWAENLVFRGDADWIEDRGTANMMKFPQLDRTELKGKVTAPHTSATRREDARTTAAAG